jgi:hypothetical protein
MCDLGTALMVGGGLLSGAGQISSANAQSKAARYNAEVQRNNAMLAERQAKNVLEAGMREEQKQKAMTQQLIGKQQAAMAASGVDTTFGTPLDRMVDTAMQGAIDDLTIRVSTYRQYDDVRNQAVSYRNQAALYDMEAKNSRTAGILGAFGSMASSFGSAYSNAVKMNPKVSSSPITKTAAYNGGKTMYGVYDYPR